MADDVPGGGAGEAL